MCIRDSANARAMVELSKKFTFVPTVDFFNGSGKVEVGANSCLLYTSDAADERSSVDLGGRRIIKKKKYVAQQP